MMSSGLLITLTIIFGALAAIGVNSLIKKDNQRVYEVHTCQDLQDMRNDLEGIYILMNNIDFKNCSIMVPLPPLEGEYLNDD